MKTKKTKGGPRKITSELMLDESRWASFGYLLKIMQPPDCFTYNPDEQFSYLHKPGGVQFFRYSLSEALKARDQMELTRAVRRRAGSMKGRAK